MVTVTNFLLCSFIVVIAQGNVDLYPDKPFLSVPLSSPAELECCYTSSVESSAIWIKHTKNEHQLLESVKSTDLVTNGSKSLTDQSAYCGTLMFKSVQLNDSGLYQCLVGNQVFSHGTFLQVYQPLEKTINLSENTKNRILTAEGILLLLCVILPSVTLLCQSKNLKQLERKKVRMEEENIYQGLNLDDCCTTYDQIERSQTNGPYQDVCNIMEEEEEIQLEKP